MICCVNAAANRADRTRNSELRVEGIPLAIIGEVAKKISPETKRAIDLPRKEIAGFRDMAFTSICNSASRSSGPPHNSRWLISWPELIPISVCRAWIKQRSAVRLSYASQANRSHSEIVHEVRATRATDRDAMAEAHVNYDSYLLTAGSCFVCRTDSVLHHSLVGIRKPYSD